MIACMAGIFVTEKKDESFFLISTCIIPSGAIQDSGNCLGPWARVRANRFMRGPVSGILGGLGERNFIKSGYLVFWGKGHGGGPGRG